MEVFHNPFCIWGIMLKCEYDDTMVIKTILVHFDYIKINSSAIYGTKMDIKSSKIELIFYVFKNTKEERRSIGWEKHVILWRKL